MQSSYYPPEIDLEGYTDERNNVTYIGTATHMGGGTYRCLARVGNALCVVEARVTILVESSNVS